MFAAVIILGIRRQSIAAVPDPRYQRDPAPATKVDRQPCWQVALDNVVVAVVVVAVFVPATHKARCQLVQSICTTRRYFLLINSLGRRERERGGGREREREMPPRRETRQCVKLRKATGRMKSAANGKHV